MSLYIGVHCAPEFLIYWYVRGSTTHQEPSVGTGFLRMGSHSDSAINHRHILYLSTLAVFPDLRIGVLSFVFVLIYFLSLSMNRFCVRLVLSWNFAATPPNVFALWSPFAYFFLSLRLFRALSRLFIMEINPYSSSCCSHRMPLLFDLYSTRAITLSSISSPYLSFNVCM